MEENTEKKMYQVELSGFEIMLVEQGLETFKEFFDLATIVLKIEHWISLEDGIDKLISRLHEEYSEVFEQEPSPALERLKEIGEAQDKLQGKIENLSERGKK
jgi:hypothetical protein